MKGTFTVKECEHGRAKFIVTGSINGRRLRAYFRTKAEAQVDAERRNIELKNFGYELSDLSAALRAEAIVCVSRLKPFGVTLSHATDFYLAQHDWHQKSVLVKDAWKECKAEFERRVASNEISLAHLKCTKKQAVKLVRDFSDTYICDLNPQILRDWLVGLPISTASRNNARVNLSGIFTYARIRGWIKDNPISEITAFNDHRLKTKLPGILTPEQAAALLEHAEREIVPYFAIGLFAGLRVAELERLDWSEIDFDDETINVKAEKAKTAQPRWVPMSENLVKWLASYRKTHGPVVPQFGRKYIIKRAHKAAGLNWGFDHSNALRHSFCSYHLALHESADKTAKDAGHMGTAMLYRNYNRRVKKDAAIRYFGIRPAPEAQNIVAIA